MNLKVALPLGAAFLLVTAMAARAREPGDPRKGRVIAETVCAACHAIDGGAGASPNGLAPSFPHLARMPGITAVALRAALQTSHRTMPNLHLRTGKREDIIAYILSLKKQGPV